MSGWYLALHRHWHLNDSIDDTFRDTLLGMIRTTSITTFHILWYRGYRDHFDTLHNLLLNVRDYHRKRKKEKIEEKKWEKQAKKGQKQRKKENW